MGLQSQLNDVSSDSIPLLLIALIASSISNLRSILFAFVRFLGFSCIDGSEFDETVYDSYGSGLAGLDELAEQLNVNRSLSYRYGEGEEGSKTGTPMAISDCIVCLSRLRRGEQVRKLDCRHVFHKQCFDGWLDHRNFNCPLCRSPLVLDRRVCQINRRVRTDSVY